jgi:hypothetical protein
MMKSRRVAGDRDLAGYARKPQILAGRLVGFDKCNARMPVSKNEL